MASPWFSHPLITNSFFFRQAMTAKCGVDVKAWQLFALVEKVSCSQVPKPRINGQRLVPCPTASLPIRSADMACSVYTFLLAGSSGWTVSCNREGCPRQMTLFGFSTSTRSIFVFLIFGFARKLGLLIVSLFRKTVVHMFKTKTQIQESCAAGGDATSSKVVVQSYLLYNYQIFFSVAMLQNGSISAGHHIQVRNSCQAYPL